jgi:hypothetical protein
VADPRRWVADRQIDDDGWQIDGDGLASSDLAGATTNRAPSSREAAIHFLPSPERPTGRSSPPVGHCRLLLCLFLLAGVNHHREDARRVACAAGAWVVLSVEFLLSAVLKRSICLCGWVLLLWTVLLSLNVYHAPKYQYGNLHRLPKQAIYDC